MTDITRDDLRVWNHDSGCMVCGDLRYRQRSVTDEEFDRLAREQGYIKWSATASDGVRFIMHWLESNPSKALRALLTDKCQDCLDGKVMVEVCDCGRFNHESHLEEREHADCGGRGWLPKDRVLQSAHVSMVEYLMDHGMGQYPIDVISSLADGAFQAWLADWLEADNE